MENPSEPRVRRSQHDYRLPVNLAVVGEVARGERSYEQAQRRYGARRTHQLAVFTTEQARIRLRHLSPTINQN